MKSTAPGQPWSPSGLLKTQLDRAAAAVGVHLPDGSRARPGRRAAGAAPRCTSRCSPPIQRETGVPHPVRHPPADRPVRSRVMHIILDRREAEHHWRNADGPSIPPVAHDRAEAPGSAPPRRRSRAPPARRRGHRPCDRTDASSSFPPPPRALAYRNACLTAAPARAEVHLAGVPRLECAITFPMSPDRGRPGLADRRHRLLDLAFAHLLGQVAADDRDLLALLLREVEPPGLVVDRGAPRVA